MTGDRSQNAMEVPSRWGDSPFRYLGEEVQQQPSDGTESCLGSKDWILDANKNRHFYHHLEKPNAGFYDSPVVRLLEEGGFKVYVYSPPREHHPPHVHVECSEGGEILVRLSEQDEPPSLWQNHHMRLKNVREAIRLVEAHQQRLLQAWRRLHGRDR